ncbi:DUF2933 domain-containing protein [Streptomyces sp. TRM68416]|uniref:DUF2933 domain-containing protein n=1 Tax=Streptomyces sp. TRM68416 TaxID=2758412 RepID=UPI001661BA1A|nr:DUF2933 domain-containing protein [Streptomyces sp. TRM68416]MBD0839439.1 DUF2933 domain-containing protein [Streptomyces sp. TRM68416]
MNTNPHAYGLYAIAVAIATVGALALGVPVATLFLGAIVLACPLMMIFMMRGMHGGGMHGGHDTGHEYRPGNDPLSRHDEPHRRP